MADIFISFMVTYPHIMLLMVPLFLICGYFWGRSRDITYYNIDHRHGTGVPIDVDIYPEEMTYADDVLIEKIIDEAVVQVLPVDQDDTTIGMIPITRIQLNRWTKLEAEDDSTE